MASNANTEITSKIPILSSHNTYNRKVPSQNTNSSSSMDDENSNPSSSYFLPPADNRGIILVSQPLIRPKNYPSWAKAMFLSMSGRNKFGFLNGSIPMLYLYSMLGIEPTQPFFHG